MSHGVLARTNYMESFSRLQLLYLGICHSCTLLASNVGLKVRVMNGKNYDLVQVAVEIRLVLRLEWKVDLTFWFGLGGGQGLGWS